MARVLINGTELVVEVEGVDKILAFKSRIVIPLRHVRGATADPGIAREPKGRRSPGTHVPRLVVAGTFHQEGDRIFWDVRDPSKAIVIELEDERFRRLVVEVENPRATVSEINQSAGAGHE